MEYKLDDRSKLKTPSVEYDFNIDGDAKLLERQLIEIMIKNKGIGLAANQVGIAKRVFVMGKDSYNNFSNPCAMFNPIIVESSNILLEDREGCLSYPGLWLKIKRPEWVLVGYYDSDGILKENKFQGYAAKCFQHELDHLNGVCFIDKISRLKLQLAMRKQRKLR